MKIINIGILAHVDAGKTTLTESLLYASGAISEPGSVEKGTTRTDTMFLERQRGITIQAAVTSFQWHRCKVNIVDTPGHMDFLAEVYRSLAVLDGAILVISAKDGVQAQTRILFHALRKMNIPTVIFINKIDQAGVDLQSVVQSVRDKLSADIIIKQTVSLSPEIVLEENTDIEAWDAVIENNDEFIGIDHQLLKSKEQGYYIETPKTKSGIRQVPLSRETIQAFQRVMKKRPKAEPFVIDGRSNFLFVNQKGKPKVAIDYNALFIRMIKKYNKHHKDNPLPHITPHTLRHTFCTRLASKNMNPKDLQYIMGHSNISITMNWYAHASIDTAKSEVQRLIA